MIFRKNILSQIGIINFVLYLSKKYNEQFKDICG